MTKHKVALLTREYPPEVYGGAGVHVEYLARELRLRTELSVHCWGSPRDEAGVTAHQPWTALSDPNPESAAFQAMSINLAMAAAVKGVELVPTAILGTRISAVTWRSSSGRSRTSYPVGRQKSIRLPLAAYFHMATRIGRSTTYAHDKTQP